VPVCFSNTYTGRVPNVLCAVLPHGSSAPADPVTVQVHQGLLYVWPDASAGSAAAADASPLPAIPELDQTEDWEPRTDWFMRDVPISFETVVENVSAVRLRAAIVWHCAH
jgi:phenylpropionate dioxygenase-like ring-hydroxylating dioxygenase large terminal subunit